jgi:hypothetical protein
MSFRKKCIYYALYVNSITTSEIKKNMYYIDIYNVKHLPFYLAPFCMDNIRLSVFNYNQETLHFRVRVIVFNVTFNNISVISCRSVLLLEETGQI